MGGADDTGSLTTENPQVAQKGQKCCLSCLLNDGQWEPVRTGDVEDRLVWTHGFSGSCVLRNGLTGSKCQADQRMSPQPLVRLSGGSCPAVITVLDLVSGLCWATFPNQFLEP